MNSQIAFVVVLADKNSNANILHYGSSRCNRVTKSVMGAEIYGLLYGFDQAICVKQLINELLERNFNIHVLADPKTIFNVGTKEGRTPEKLLKIDVWAIKEIFANCELKYLPWIPDNDNVADTLTKKSISYITQF